MKKLLLVLALLLCGCSKVKTYIFKVIAYYYSIVWVSESIAETIHIAMFEDNINLKCYVQVPLSYHESKIKVRYTGNNVEFHINLQKNNFYGYSNGWEVLK